MSTIDELMLQLADPEFNPLEWGPQDIDNVINFMRTARGEKPRRMTEPEEVKKLSFAELGVAKPVVRTVVKRRF